MADIAHVTLPDNSQYNIKDDSAVATITRNGSSVIATKRDGTSGGSVLYAETIDYEDYEELTPQERNDGVIRFCNDYPEADGYVYYDEDDKALCFSAGVGYDPTTKTLVL